jgi:galactose mutarotase-like enzyme
MGDVPHIGGAPVVTLKAEAPRDRPGFVEATILPGRGMMLLQARVRRPSGEILDALFAPPVEEAARRLDGGPDDFAGNQAFLFGGAILAPFANRIRGRPLHETREIEAHVDGRRVRLPRNWGGKAPGAEEYAMHGLILDADVAFEQPNPHHLTGRLEAGDFRGRWPSRAELTFDWRLRDGELSLRIEAVNLGPEVLPMGIGWHPYFALPSGDRTQARLRLPADLRTEVNDYDEVLPTGRLQRIRGSVYDFGGETGAALGELYLDDCFTGLRRENGRATVEVRDPAGGLGFRIDTPSPAVKAVQVFAPPDRPFVVLEPQFNLADPFGEVWPPEVDTGMARLPPGGRTAYEVRLSAFAIGT